MQEIDPRTGQEIKPPKPKTRAEVETELSEIVGRMHVLLPRTKCPPFVQGGSGEEFNRRSQAAADEHDHVCREYDGLKRRAEALRLQLGAGLPMAETEPEWVPGRPRTVVEPLRQIPHTTNVEPVMTDEKAEIARISGALLLFPKGR